MGRKGGNPILDKKRPRKRGGQDLLDRFGIYLCRRRLANNLSIRQFAKLARLPASSIFQFESLRKNPRLTELDLLARAFEQSLAKFVEPLQRNSSADSAGEEASDRSATSASSLGENSQII